MRGERALTETATTSPCLPSAFYSNDSTAHGTGETRERL